MRMHIFAALAALGLAAASAAAQDHDPHGSHGESQDHEGMDHGAMSGLAASSPADGETVQGSPRTLTLEFDHAMTLSAVRLTTLSMERIDLDFEPSREPVERVEIPLETLEPGEYTVEWQADGGDHEMSGAFRFTVA